MTTVPRPTVAISHFCARSSLSEIQPECESGCVTGRNKEKKEKQEKTLELWSDNIRKGRPNRKPHKPVNFRQSVSLTTTHTPDTPLFWMQPARGR